MCTHMQCRQPSLHHTYPYACSNPLHTNAHTHAAATIPKIARTHMHAAIPHTQNRMHAATPYITHTHMHTCIITSLTCSHMHAAIPHAHTHAQILIHMQPSLAHKHTHMHAATPTCMYSYMDACIPLTHMPICMQLLLRYCYDYY